MLETVLEVIERRTVAKFSRRNLNVNLFDVTELVGLERLETFAEPE